MHTRSPARSSIDVLSVAIGVTAATALGALVVLAWCHRVFTVDDAFITLRYSSNLAHGSGPTWNPGEAPVEGYTTFLWMALLAIPHLVGVDALAFAKVVGVAAAIACMPAAGALGWEIARGASRPACAAAGAMAAIVVGSCTSTAVHAVSGMETTLFTFLVTTFFVTLLRSRRRQPLVPALVGLAAALTRPEGNLLVAVAFAVVLWSERRRSARRALALAAALGWVLPYGAYFAWRLSYYGLPAPLSFYVKATNEPGVFRGTDEVVGILHMFFVAQPYLGVPLLVAVAVRARRIAPMLAAAVAFLAFFLVPAPIMAYERRYLYPIVPSLVAAAAAGVAIAGDRVARTWVSRRRAAALAVLAFAALAAIDTATHARGSIDGWTAYGEGLRHAHLRLARDLRERYGPASKRTVALVDVGAVAYVSEWRTIDTFGLNDAHIARTGRHDAAYVEAQDPDVVVVISQRPDRLVPFAHLAWEKEIYDAFVTRGYAPAGAYRFAPDYFLLPLERPALHDEMRR